MAEETEGTAPEQQETPPNGGEESGGDLATMKAALAKANAEAKDYRLKFRQTEKELNDTRQSTMTEVEKLTAEAEKRGRSAATAEFGTRLARTEFDAAAGRINPEFKTEDVVNLLNLSALLDEDGNPDSAKIKTAAETFVRPPSGTPSYDGGSRKAAKATGDMNGIIRNMAGLG